MEGAGPHLALSAFSAAIREIICEGCGATWVADGEDKDWHTSETEPYCLVCSRFLLPPSPPALSGSASSCQPYGGLAAGMAPGQATSSTGHPRSDVALSASEMAYQSRTAAARGHARRHAQRNHGGHGDVVLPGCRTRAGE